MANVSTRITSWVVFCAILALAVPAFAGGKRVLEVTVTNLTRGQVFAPVLVVSHRPGVRLFAPGATASDALAALAEGGDTGPLADELLQDAAVIDVADSGALLHPGESTTVRVSARRARQVSLAAMLVSTNDAFVALNGVAAPWSSKKQEMYMAVAWDAGSESNEEACADVPGPPCGGAGPSPGDDGEGYVHVHPGIHGGGDLDPSELDWRNPVARVVIQRVRE